MLRLSSLNVYQNDWYNIEEKPQCYMIQYNVPKLCCNYKYIHKSLFVSMDKYVSMYVEVQIQVQI